MREITSLLLPCELALACQAVVTRLLAARPFVPRLVQAELDQKTPTTSIHQDNTEEIAAGKSKLAYLTEYAAKAPERAAQLADAQRISDALLLVGEMDNPYTTYSMGTLKGARTLLTCAAARHGSARRSAYQGAYQGASASRALVLTRLRSSCTH